MRGIGRASAAITFVNALATGVGAAASIGLSAEARVELHRGSATDASTGLELAVGERTPLVEASFSAGLTAFTPGPEWSGRLELRSSVPVACGLKSSSAVSVAILRSVAQATGRTVATVDAARLSAGLAQRIGLSATGAFDDALACAGGGVVLTDNRTRRLLRRERLPADLTVLLWIPPGRHEPSPQWKESFVQRTTEGEAAVDAFLSGDLFEAMERNTQLVEAVMGYDYADVRRRLKEAGALGAGVSGLGPALAAVLPSSRVIGGRDALQGAAGQLLVTAPRPPGELEEGAP